MAKYVIATLVPELLEDEKRQDAIGLTEMSNKIADEIESYKVNLGGKTGSAFTFEKDSAMHTIAFHQRRGVSADFIDSLLSDSDTVNVDPTDDTVTLTKQEFLAAIDGIDPKYFVKVGTQKGSLRGVLMLREDYDLVKAYDKSSVLTVVTV